MFSRRLFLACLISIAAAGQFCSAATPSASRLQTARLEAAIASAQEYLLRTQSDDGAWRSDVYPPFAVGDALSPLVLLALSECPQSGPVSAAIERGKAWLLELSNDFGAIESGEKKLAYPVYAAAAAVMVLAHDDRPEAQRACRKWVEFLRRRQLAEALGWSVDDLAYGGWGYAQALPTKPAGDAPLSPIAEPNLSATVFALEALRHAGVEADDVAVKRALVFVERCQNFDDDAPSAANDGGFYFVQRDAVRNKAGLAEGSTTDAPRFASYGSATADGLRALYLCGAAPGHPRVTAAVSWLSKNHHPDIHPGAYTPDREVARQSLYFYYCQSFAALLESAKDQTQAIALCEALAARQVADGRWQNFAVDAREDDPLVATTMATLALARCQRALAVWPDCLLPAP